MKFWKDKNLTIDYAKISQGDELRLKMFLKSIMEN